MKKPRNRWLVGCSISCGVVVVLGILVLGGSIWSLNRHYGKAHDSRMALEQKHGDRDAFDPGTGSIIATTRMRRFVAVRRALQDQCAHFRANNEDLVGLARFDSVENVPRSEILAQGWRTTRSMLGAAKGLGDFALTRNRALLNNCMGFGEYTWIYVLVYYAGLGKDPVLHMDRDSGRPGRLGDRLQASVMAMMERRAAALLSQADDPETSDSLKPVLLAEAAAWRAEIDVMAAEPGRPPFVDGAPAFISRVVAPFADELDSLFCPDTDALELMRIKARGAGYEDS